MTKDLSEAAVNLLKSQVAIRSLYSRFVHLRGELELREGKKLWARHTILTAAETNKRLGALIASGRSFSAGKIGANERNLLMWAYGVRASLGIAGFGRHVKFRQTSNCATNAGLVPRTTESYREVADVIDGAVSNLDILAIWHQSGEYSYLKSRNYLGIDLCCLFDLQPYFVDDPWTTRLAGRRVLFVSPFAQSAERQHPLLAKIWPNGLMPNFELVTYKFPYLFSEEQSGGLSWQQARDDFKNFALNTEFDIALIGAGGLSLPIAEICRGMGRQAIHLGGGAQLLFGIRGSQYEADEKYANLMNGFWTKPMRSEIPREASSIENGMYW
jgi:hypothetical protein